MSAEEHKVIAGRYEVISQIGSGGIAVVYKARDPRLDKTVAVKMLHPEMMTGEAIMRFQLEAKMASTLLHPNLIRVLDFGITEDNEPYLVMDFVDGITLSDYLEQQGRIPFSIASGIFIQICDGMALAHEQNLLHRDLKTSNVMLTDHESAQPKAFVLDFGLAKRIEDASLTRTGVLIGSPLYMSPEHARGAELDNRADIYSMGCIMYECLTGTPPISGESVLDTIMKQTTEEAPLLRDSCPDEEFSPELEHIVATTLKKDPGQRFQSMRDLKLSVEALRQSTQRSPTIVKQRQTLQEQIASSITAAPPPTSPSPLSKKFILSCIALIVIIGGIGLVVAQMVPAIIDFVHPHVEDTTTKKLPTPRDQLLDDDGGIGGILPGSSKRWEPIKWNDGIAWHKKFGITEDDFADIDKVHDMEYVSCWQEAVTPIMFKQIAKAKIKGLYLSECDGLNETLMREIEHMTTLQVLHLDKSPGLRDQSLRHILPLKNLRILGLTMCSFSDDALKYVEGLSNLEILYLDHMRNLRGTGFKHLQKLKRLQKLKLSESKDILPGAVSDIGQIKSLKVLLMHEVFLTQNTAAQLATLPQLQILDISACGLNDQIILAWKPCKTLKQMWIGENAHVSKQAIEELQKSTPGLQVYKADAPQVDNYLYGVTR